MIYIVTADKIADTGERSWKYMFDSKPPDDFRDWMMEKLWGYAEIIDRRDLSYAFNIFKSGEGFQVGGGWMTGLSGELPNGKMVMLRKKCSECLKRKSS